MSNGLQSVETIPTDGLQQDQVAYRAWLRSLSVGDQVEIAYSRLPSDAFVVKVIDHDGGWITLETGWLPEDGPDILKACALNGTAHAAALWPVGKTARKWAESVKT